MSVACSKDFQSLSEAIERLSDAQRPKRDDLASISNQSSQSWDLNTPFSVARKMAATGWQEKAGDLWKQVAALAVKIDPGVRESFDVTGEAVDVGRYLGGEPECMFTQTITPMSAVSVMMNISARANAHAEYIFNRGIAVAAIIHALQGAGRGVALSVCESVRQDGGSHETFITLQEFGEYINPARLAFWAAHPAALRRCIFRYNEQQPDEIREQFEFHSSGGYGAPQDLDMKKLPPGTVYIPFPETDMLERYYTTPELALKTVIKEFQARGVNIDIVDGTPKPRIKIAAEWSDPESD